MSTNDEARTPVQLANALRYVAALIEQGGTPGRVHAASALEISYQVSEPEYVTEFAARYGITVQYPGSGQLWANLPVGHGAHGARSGHLASYSGAVVLSVVYVPRVTEDDS